MVILYTSNEIYYILYFFGRQFALKTVVYVAFQIAICKALS